MKGIFKIFLFAFWLFIGLPSISIAQCVVCRSAVENGAKEGEDGLAKGINNGILYLMAIPYVLIGATGYIIYKNHKKKSSAEE
jgi:hypothetical protein